MSETSATKPTKIKVRPTRRRACASEAHERPNQDPEDFDADKCLRNQARFQALDEKRVDQYAEAMRRGDEFPPVIAHGRIGKLEIADGNHRLHGGIKTKKPLNAYIIKGDPQTIVMITFEANSRHGLPSTEDERVQHGLYLMDNGASMKPPVAAA